MAVRARVLPPVAWKRNSKGISKMSEPTIMTITTVFAQ
jgi:hypothetical protein